MLFPVALSVTLLIFAFTTLPKVDTDASRPAHETTEPHTQMPTFRSIDMDKPKAIKVHATEPSLNEISRWLSDNFDLPHSDNLPQIERVPAAQLHRLRYKGLLPPPSLAIGGEHATPYLDPQREVVAIYNDSTRTIYLREDWTGDSAAEQSVLVHEMVHHLQNVAGLKYECSGAREKPAYLAQHEWLKLHGFELETTFDVDMFTIVALSACMH
ncbi:DUF6647 family protein [Bradyrhizobium sp. LHD-71]|uniref:DUF6647 family protein n=1 Tax=Bradyrhizobium sp. LHD-71 TaxID=3072141 RepID=UPI00280DEA2B|nr:DUF6647 family protein [Bradyrhizobium sp. LHD-71]MDQ8731638.1 hypothetical protein [Bradyrhizobium sp. LHD-71]